MRWLIFVLLAIIGAAGWLYLAPGTANTAFGFGNDPNAAPTRYGALAFGYVVTLVGVLLGSMYRELQRRRAADDTHLMQVRQFLSGVFRSTDFWMGLCGSPLVYALLLQGIDSGNLPGLTVVALQNGFTCTIALDGIMKGQPRPTSPESTTGG